MPNFIKILVSVLVNTCWMLVPRRIRVRFERPWHRKGIRLVEHTSGYGHGDPNWPVMYTVMFGSGAGYIGGATLYLAFGGCRVRDTRPWYYGRRPVQHFVFGLTNNANNIPLTGCWS